MGVLYLNFEDEISLRRGECENWFFLGVLKGFPLINEGHFGHFAILIKTKKREESPVWGALHLGKSPPLPISFPLTFSLSPIVPLCTPPPFLPAMEVSRCDPSFLILPSPSSHLSLFLPFFYHFSLSKPHSLSLPLIEVVVQFGLLGHRRWVRVWALRLELVDGG